MSIGRLGMVKKPDMENEWVIDACAGSGAWSKPYKDEGYNVWPITLPEDIRLVHYRDIKVRGILAAPPCTVFASSGARWPRSDQDYIDALSVVDACLRLVTIYQPDWWALENPIGKLKRWLGPPKMYFNPCDYGDPYTKKTALWGQFTPPKLNPVEPVKNSPIHFMPPGPERAAKRSITPAGFARAFMMANP
jgi:hypothetical protein